MVGNEKKYARLFFLSFNRAPKKYNKVQTVRFFYLRAPPWTSELDFG